MKFSIRKKISDALLFGAVGGIAITWFFSGIWELTTSVIFGTGSFGLLFLASWIRPHFWQLNNSIKQPVNDSAQKINHAQDT
jgi:hypothetical protein